MRCTVLMINFLVFVLLTIPWCATANNRYAIPKRMVTTVYNGTSLGYSLTDMLLDRRGRLIIVDFNSGVLWQMAPNGTTRVFAPGGASFFSLTLDDDGPTPVFYGADYGNHQIVRSTYSATVDSIIAWATIAGSTAGYRDGVGTNAQFKNPTNLIVRLLPNGTLELVAGQAPGPTFDTVLGLSLSPDESTLYVSANYQVEQVDLTNSKYAISTIAGVRYTIGYRDGPADTALFTALYGCRYACFDNISCGILVADMAATKVRFVSLPPLVSLTSSLTESVTPVCTMTAPTTQSQSNSNSFSASETNITSDSISTTFPSNSRTTHYSLTANSTSSSLSITGVSSSMSMCTCSDQLPIIAVDSATAMDGGYSSQTTVAALRVSLTTTQTRLSDHPNFTTVAMQQSIMDMDPWLMIGLRWPLGASCWSPSNVSLRSQPIMYAYDRRMNSSLADGDIEDTLVIQPYTTPGSSPVPWVLSSDAMDVVLNITMTCMRSDEEADRTATYSLHIPVTASKAPDGGVLYSEVKVATTVIQWSALIFGPGGGPPGGRIVAVRSLSLCGGGDSDALALGIAPFNMQGCGARTTLHEAARGGTFGNVMILCACTVGALFLAAVIDTTLYRVNTFDDTRPMSFKERAIAAVRRLSLPSLLIPVWLVVIASTAMSTTILIYETFSTSDYICAGDVVLSLISVVAVCIAPIVSVHAAWRWACAKMRVVNKPLDVDGSTSGNTVRLMWLTSVARRWRWVPRTEDGSAARVKDDAKHISLLLLEYRGLSYGMLDPTVLAVTGAIAGISALGNELVCKGAASCVLVVFLFQLVVCVVQQPFSTLFSNVHGTMTLALSAMSAGAQLGFIVSSNEDLLLWSGVSDLLVVGITLFRMLLDAYDMCKGLRRIYHERPGGRHHTIHMQRHGSSNIHKGSFIPPLPLVRAATPDPTSSLHSPSVAIVEEEGEDVSDALALSSGSLTHALEVSHDRDDGLYWTPSGHALVLNACLPSPGGNNDNGLLL